MWSSLGPPPPNLCLQDKYTTFSQRVVALIPETLAQRSQYNMETMNKVTHALDLSSIRSCTPAVPCVLSSNAPNMHASPEILL